MNSSSFNLTKASLFEYLTMYQEGSHKNIELLMYKNSDTSNM